MNPVSRTKKKRMEINEVEAKKKKTEKINETKSYFFENINKPDKSFSGVTYVFFDIEYYTAIKKKQICHLQQYGWTVRALCKLKQVRQRKTDSV